MDLLQVFGPRSWVRHGHKTAVGQNSAHYEKAEQCETSVKEIIDIKHHRKVNTEEVQYDSMHATEKRLSGLAFNENESDEDKSASWWSY